MKTLTMISLTLPLFFGLSASISAQKTHENMPDDTLFIYHLKLTPEYENPEVWTEETMGIIRVHAAFLDSLGKAGTLAFAGRTAFKPGDENLFGIAVIKASSLREAKEIMAPDPAVVNGIQHAQIFPFSMGIRYFENLK